MSFPNYKLFKNNHKKKLNSSSSSININSQENTKPPNKHIYSISLHKSSPIRKTNKITLNNSTAAEGSSSLTSSCSLRIMEVLKRKSQNDTQRHNHLLNKINIKTTRVNQNQQRQRKEIEKEKEQMNKRFELRELRRKVFKITDNDSFNLCDSFIRDNDAFNMKFLSFIRGKKYFNRTKNYQSNFHYHVNDLSEGHDKYNMLIDIDKLRLGSLPPDKLLKRNLSEAEIKIIRQDPYYFIKKPRYLKNVKELQKITLLEKLKEEDHNDNDNEPQCSISDDGNNSNADRRFIKTNRVKDLRFSWTLFDSKINDAMHKVKRKLDALKTNQGFYKETRPDLETKLRDEIDENFKRMWNKKFSSTFRLNFKKRLPRKQLKAYLNQEVSNRLKNESEFIEKRESIIEHHNNEEYTNQLQLRRIRDNLINKKG